MDNKQVLRREVTYETISVFPRRRFRPLGSDTVVFYASDQHWRYLMKKILAILLSFLVTSTLLTGCAGPSPTTASATADSLAETTLSAALDTVVNPEQSSSDQEESTAAESSDDSTLRIVSTVPSATEILFALGCGEQIVGIDVSSTYPAETAEIEKVGDYNGFDVETIISLEPDVVFVGYTIQDAQVEQLQNAGIHTSAVEARALSDLSESILTIGDEVGKGDEAEALVDSIESTISTVKETALSMTNSPSVYYVMGFGEYGNWTSGEGSFINDMIEAAGGTCVTADAANAWIEYPMEDLILADPDILLVSSYISLDDLKADPAYAELSAVKNGRVFSVNSDIVERPGPRVTEAMAEIQNIFLENIGE